MGTSISVSEGLQKRLGNRGYKKKYLSGAVNVAQSSHKNLESYKRSLPNEQLILTNQNEPIMNGKSSLEQKATINDQKIQNNFNCIPQKQIKNQLKMKKEQNNSDNLTIKLQLEKTNQNAPLQSKPQNYNASVQHQSSIFAYLNEEAIQNFKKASEKRKKTLEKKSKNCEDINATQDNQEKEHRSSLKKIQLKKHVKIIKNFTVDSDNNKQFQIPQSNIISISNEKLINRQQQQSTNNLVPKLIHMQQASARNQLQKNPFKKVYQSEEVKFTRKIVSINLAQYD